MVLRMFVAMLFIGVVADAIDGAVDNYSHHNLHVIWSITNAPTMLDT